LSVRICRKLRKIKIYNSKIDDDKFYAVYDGMKNLPAIGKASLTLMRFQLAISACDFSLRFQLAISI
jgi:hypothetical protein